MVNYEPLWETMKLKKVTTYALIHKYKISSKTVNNLKHNRGITVFTLERLCNILECTPMMSFSFFQTKLVGAI